LKQSKPTDFPNYLSEKEKFDSTQQALDDLLRERDTLASQWHGSQGGVEIQAQQLLSSDGYIDTTTLGRQISDVDHAIRIHEKGVELQRVRVENARGQASLEICQQARPAFVEQIKVILKSLKQICAANETLDRLRDDLERDGVASGSIPAATLAGIGSFDDHMKMGTAFVYKTWIERNFPEIKA
jgi:hypothetical protein